MDKVREAAFEAAAHVFAVWLSIANWIERHKHWTLLIIVALILLAVKF